jgi:hypothetical protein
LKSTREAIERQDSNELIYIQVEQGMGIKNFNTNQKEFITWLTRADNNITESRERQVIDGITKNYLYY